MRIQIVIVLLIVSQASASAEQTTNAGETHASAISKVVKQCIDTVHSHGFSHFDAFYNPATGGVRNNAFYVADQPAVYWFEKCMAEQGYPLK